MRVLIACTLSLIVPAHADDHQHPTHDQALHDKFYSTWLVPNGGYSRRQSCCNKKDCAAVRAVRRKGDIWEAQRDSDGSWLRVPPSKVESNQPDPRQSPDGRSHMCSVETNVICFVLGSDI